MRGMYLHYPFCVKKCNYCDFAVSTDQQLKDNYLSSLVKEIEIFSNSNSLDNSINTIYFGGGTPSIMSPEELEKVLSIIKDNFLWDKNIEITLETNPGTVDKTKLQAYKELGVNRLSVGVQSFQKRELGMLTRNHSPNTAINTIESALDFGINNISLDLIFSVPGQSIDTFLDNLKIAIELGIQHISTYSLTYEPGTKLFNDWKDGKIKKQGSEFDAELFGIAIDFLEDEGFEQYEVSNFAKNGNYSIHNLSAWENKEYFAFGNSAHGYLDGNRFSNHNEIRPYLSKISNNELPIDNIEKLSKKQIIEEYIFLGLRSRGIKLSFLNKQYNIGVGNGFLETIKDLKNQDFVNFDGDHIRFKKKGYMICDTLSFKILENIFLH